MKEIPWTVQIPKCDFCWMIDGVVTEGPIDGPTIGGPWANMCDAHFKTYGFASSTITTRKVRPINVNNDSQARG